MMRLNVERRKTMRGLRQHVSRMKKNGPALPMAIGVNARPVPSPQACAGSSRQEHPITNRADVGWSPTRRTF